MSTIHILPVATINGTTYAAAQLILTPVSPDRQKTILPKQEPLTPPVRCDDIALSKKFDNAKRRIHFSKKALNHPKPQSVTRRNARERNRVKQVNQGFVTLANHVPSHLRSKKMSKVDTLRAAIDYINELHDLLNAQNSSRLDRPPVSSIAPPPDNAVPSPMQVLSAPSDTFELSECPSRADIPKMFQPQFNFASKFSNKHSYYDSHQSCSDTCPSPGSSDSGFESHDHEQITPEYEAELLEFASWFQ